MIGRPKRTPNRQLCERFEAARLSLGLSLEDAARMLGVHKATISRSLREEGFSPELAGKVSLFLTRYEVGDKARDPDEETALRLLHKFAMMAPEIENALRIVLDRARSRS